VPLEFPHTADYALLCVVPHGTGVDQHDVRILRFFHPNVAIAAQNPEHQLRVGHVHLATVRLDVDAFQHGHKIAGLPAHGLTEIPKDRLKPFSE
jgi:hypothetical protein